MFTTLITFVAAFVVASVAAAEDLSVNTPHGGVTECKEVTFTWQGGDKPYSVSVLNADEPCDAALLEFPSTEDTWLHWLHPNITGKILVAVEDKSGDEAWTQEITVQKDAGGTCPPPPAATAASASPSGSGSGVTLVPAATVPQPPPSVPTPPSGSGNGGPAANVGAISGARVNVDMGMSLLLGSFVGLVSFVAL